MKKLMSVALVLVMALQMLVSLGVAQAQGKTIVVGMAQEPDRLFHSAMAASQNVMNALLDGLVTNDDRMQVFAQLAEEVPTIENGGAQFVGEGMDKALQVTFKLRQGVTWSDGQPFTSADVKATYDLVMNPEAGYDTSLESKIDRLDTPDDYTVVITYLSANAARQADPGTYAGQTDPVIDPGYIFGVNLDETRIYPSHVLKAIVGGDLRTSPDVTALDSSDFSRHPVGTGAYTLESWDPGAQLVLRARSDSWKGVPAISTVVFRIIPAKDTLLAALQAGEVDVITNDALDVGDAAVLDEMAGITPHYVPGTAWEHLTLNLDSPILKDKDVRQALAYGLDRDELVNVLLYGKSEVAHSQVPSWSWAFNPDVFKYPFNPRRANALLDLAGWDLKGADGVRVKNGQRLSIRLWSTNSVFRPRSLPLIKDQLARIGVEINIELIAPNVLLDSKASTPQALRARLFDIAEFGYVGGYDPGDSLRSTNHSSNIPSKDNGYRGFNIAGFRNDKNDLLLSQGSSILDQDLRAFLYRDNQYILMEELPIIPLFARPQTSAATSKLLNFRPAMNTAGETWNIEQWDLQ